ncbi:L,D-transpeptidase family protein [Martelella radicis]|uniref:L,D-peptidoglycan transpeptidase YkuD (ErfK/YbiS/YcfS/YnhG family) n=1 Tax=Martelella radicis TaxID=1397476 RepID=A0A7W6PA28_9HYPH|nr:L,D-peptidoglycan transpeptidase YkuD (ErfK/YbiS/YcfS/YnhG family) [Martelella radicis]
MKKPIKTRRSNRTVIAVRPAPGGSHRAILAFGPLRFPAAIGHGGISARKREGDGATPLAVMTLAGGLVRNRLPILPQSPLGLRGIRADDGWCDAPCDPNYNRPVRLPFSASHERLRRDDGIYDIVIILDWNMNRRVKGRGSAVFFHLARPGFQPTAGCVAISASAMRVMLPHLKRGTRLVVLR